MLKRIVSAILLLTLILTIPATAMETRAISNTPMLSFDGTTATCAVVCSSGNKNDSLLVSLTLWQGDTRLGYWRDAGQGEVVISKKYTVKSGTTYKLVHTYSVNGIPQPALSVSAKCP